MSALHGLILLYEKQFQIAALRNTEAERTGVGNVSTSLTPTGWIHVSIEPTELEASLGNETKPQTPRNFSKSDSPPVASPSSSVSSEEHFIDSLPRKSQTIASFVPSSSPSSIGSNSGKIFYTHVWKSMIFLASDPNPSVAQMAQHVVHCVHDKVCFHAFTRSHSNC